MNVFEIALLGVAGFSAIYEVVTMFRLRRHLRRKPIENSELFPPVTFWRAVKSGTPGLREKLQLLADAARPGDQVLVGVDNDADESIARQIPGVQVVRCKPGRVLNPKINKLVQMESHALHEHWVLSDSEALLDRAFAGAFLDEWRGCDVLTAGYRFENAQSLPQACDAASALLTLWPGLMGVKAKTSFTLGACTGVRRGDVAPLGGWAALGNLLAEDYALGNRLSKMGRRIRLCASVLALDCDALGWGGWLAHQVRVAFTYRVCNPAGFFAMLLTHGVTAGAVLALLSPVEPWRWLVFLGAYAIRLGTGFANARALHFRLPWLPACGLLHSIAESVCWVAAWFVRSVRWGETRLRVTRAGTIRAVE